MNQLTHLKDPCSFSYSVSLLVTLVKPSTDGVLKLLFLMSGQFLNLIFLFANLYNSKSTGRSSFNPNVGYSL